MPGEQMLSELHTAVVDRLAVDISSLATCASYPRLNRKIDIPAVLIDQTELEPADFGTDKFDCWVMFTAYCIVDPNQTDAELAVRNLAAQVAVRVSQEEDFSIEVERAAEVVRVSEDNLNPDLEGYLVWSVDFQIGMALGEDAWLINPAADVAVTTITVGDLDTVHIDKLIDNEDEPETSDTISLPEQPKG